MSAVPSRIALSELDDRQLMDRMRELARRDTVVTAGILAHLGEVDERRLYLGEGHPNLFDYCRRGLGFSEGATYKRIQAARACRRRPELLVAVEDGRLHLSAVGLLAPHVTDANVTEVIAAAARQSKRDLEVLVERLRHPGPLECSPGPKPESAGLPPGPVHEPPGRPAPSGGQPSFNFTRTVSTDSAPEPEPVGPARNWEVSRALTLRTTSSFRTKLDKARALLGHSVPSGDCMEILERALDVLVEKLEKRRFGAPKTAAAKAAAAKAAALEAAAAQAAPTQAAAPQAVEAAAAPESATRRAPRQAREPIPAATRRAVFERDGGCCTFVGAGGQRCRSTFALEIHHIKAVMEGGTHNPENLTLHCRPHNAFVAEQEGQSPRLTRRKPRPRPTPGKPTPGRARDAAIRQPRITQGALFPEDGAITLAAIK